MLNHKGTKTLTTERLVLRQFKLEDVEAMYKNWTSDERVKKFLSWSLHKSVDETRKLLQSWCAGYENDTTYNWVITLNGEPIGSISVIEIIERDESCELGYCSGYDFWGNGYMTEAAKAVVDYLFGEIGMHRIAIRHVVKNPASGRVAQKCGFTLEGVTRKSRYTPSLGEFLDMAYYGILREEWVK